MPRNSRSFIYLALDARNAWAHPPMVGVPSDDALRYLDPIHQLLLAVKSGEADAVKALHREQVRIAAGISSSPESNAGAKSTSGRQPGPVITAVLSAHSTAPEATEASRTRYDALRKYLEHQNLSEIVLTFQEIETIIGAALPSSAQRPQFWANLSKEQHKRGPNRSAREAGFKTFLIDSNRVRFRRET